MFRRKIKALALVFILLFTTLFCACVVPIKEETDNGGDGGISTGENTLPGDEEKEDYSSGAGTESTVVVKSGSVNFIDVGNGECILIKFPDGKNMLIDSGAKTSLVTTKINDALSVLEDKRIDLFVVSHPDEEHIGNAINILNNYDVKKVYFPKILSQNLSLFPEMENIKKRIDEKGIEYEESDFYDYIKGDGYSVAFLSPKAKRGSYDRLNKNPTPSKANVNDISPIIYVDIYGKRFVLTADAGKLEEETVVDLNAINFYNEYLSGQGVTVNLEEVDFLKISDGGDDQASTQEFLDLLKPKNAILSVGGNNYLGLPSSSVLIRLQNANENYKLYRTDVHGDVTVTVKEDGSCKITTQGD